MATQTKSAARKPKDSACKKDHVISDKDIILSAKRGHYMVPCERCGVSVCSKCELYR